MSKGRASHEGRKAGSLSALQAAATSLCAFAALREHLALSANSVAQYRRLLITQSRKAAKKESVQTRCGAYHSVIGLHGAATGLPAFLPSCEAQNLSVETAA